MIRVRSKALDKEISIQREIGRFGGDETGPTIIIFAGIHGNEPSGVFAINQVLSQLKESNPQFSGQLIALTGNAAALERGERYIDRDLNRIWHADFIKKIRNGGFEQDEVLPDINEQIEIYKQIDNIFKTHKPPYYFIDLHTTSADSVPFITLNDTLRNRDFALQFPLPSILGIEEFLSGTMLSFVNELGPIAIGFEAGSHDVASSIDNHISCIWLTLAFSGCMKAEQIPDYQKHFDSLHSQSKDSKKVFEIRFRHERTEEENFEMLAGFENFQPVKKGQHLAENDSGKLYAVENGRIFLPLYQKQGDDGYFIVREIKMFWLKVSAHLRRFNAERLLKVLPGINQDKKDPHTFLINTKVAHWLFIEIFHLLGFRHSVSTDNHHYFIRRKFDTEEPEIYTDEFIDSNL
ncbi:MAG: aspartoacylase [Calditrichaeota bacterium]|nr:MAG: aspartoacylase [Calditrichota bacterium]MBL1205545.1 aspartoacylase [Calditrichota bacterium]NOG45374.1 aspartoacylase [Calditrichota bacterium]